MFSGIKNKVFVLFFSVILSTSTANPSKPTIYVIGDSTASEYDSDQYPRTGWAQVLQPFINSDSITVSDKAASGRSSKSYYEEKGKWDVVSQLLKSGDYLFIQFAHNDEKTDSRHTDPETTFKDYLNMYINGAKEKGAYPVLLSSIPRNNWSGSGIQQAHKPYTKAMKEVADSAKVPFIDMEAGTMAYLNKKGKAYTTDSVFNNLKAGIWPNYINGNSDGTHLQEKGAFELCSLFMVDLQKLEGFPEIDRLKNCTQQAIRISAMPEPYLKGKITGNGVYPAHSQVTLSVRPATGYEFSRWMLVTDTATYSTEATLNLATDTVNLDFQAHFKSSVDVSMQKANEIRVYPNPAQSRIFLETGLENWKVELTDMNGKVWYSAENKSVIDVQNFLSGIYLLNIQSEENMYTQKIVIQ
ncbi:MAG TPA: T9SS type A sorting domain-containing protein [Prolixibacteraceae bacterium]|nr:T9SS type A sorting domain-containing protein [Prolixibacteraceae bacterium]